MYEFDTVEFQKSLYEGLLKFDIVTWNKIYKKELFDDLKFSVEKTSEYQFLIPKITFKCKKIVCINKNIITITSRIIVS